MQQDTVWSRTGVVAGVVAAVAAVAVLLPGPWRGTSEPPPAERTAPPASPTSSSTSTGSASASVTTTAPVAAPSIPLASLEPVEGRGFLTVSGDGLRMTCGTNQSADTYRDVAYLLPTRFARLDLTVRAEGGASLGDALAVEVYGRSRYDRSDQDLLLSTTRVDSGASRTVRAELGEAEALRLRLTCRNPGMAAILVSARLVR